jgi:hypothetical protein
MSIASQLTGLRRRGGAQLQQSSQTEQIKTPNQTHDDDEDLLEH